MYLIPQFRAGRRASGAFNPLDDTGLMLWIDPSTLSTLWQDTGASTAVAADSDPVDLAQDRSSNARNLIGVGTTARPLYKTSGGLHWLEFDGTNDYLYRTSAFMYAAGACSVFVGYYSGQTTTVRQAVCEGRSSSNTPSYIPMQNGATTGTNMSVFYRTDGGTTALNSTTDMGVVNDSAAHVVSILDSGSAIINYIDGAAGTSRSYTRAATTLDRFSLGCLLRTTAANFKAMRIYQLLIVNREVNSTDRALYESFVAARCGVTL